MKTMMKKGVVYATFTAALLVMAALVTGCSTPESSGGGDGYKPPAGMGSIQLNFAKDLVRSITPETDIDDFTRYDLTFTGDTEGPIATMNITAANIKNPIDLVPDTYALEVVGYTAVGDVAVASISNSPGIVVTLGQNTNFNITLTAYNPVPATADTSTGKFAWKITTSGLTGTPTLTTATMVVTVIQTNSSNAATTPTVNFLTTNAWNANVDSNATLNTGYYYVDFTFVIDGITMTFRHVLHIYKNMTSSFEYELKDNYFTVVKSTVKVNTIDVDPIVDTVPVLTWTNNKTTPDTGTIDEGDTVTILLSGDGTTTASTVTITVTNASTFTASSVKWYCNSTTPLVTGVSGTSGEIFTANKANSPFNAKGTYLISVEGRKSGVPYSTFFYVEVDN